MLLFRLKKERCPQTGLWPRAVMVGPRPRVLVTPPLLSTVQERTNRIEIRS